MNRLNNIFKTALPIIVPLALISPIAVFGQTEGSIILQEYAPSALQDQSVQKLDSLRDSLGLLGETITNRGDTPFPNRLPQIPEKDRMQLKEMIDSQDAHGLQYLERMGGITGSGGSGVICFENSKIADEAFQGGKLNYDFLNRATKIQVLDYWEGDEQYQFFTPESKEDPAQFAKRVIKTYLHGVRPTSAAMAYYGLNSLQRAERIKSRNLPQIEDVEPLKKELPPNCRLVQLAIQFVVLGEEKKVDSTLVSEKTFEARPLKSQVYMEYDQELLDAMMRIEGDIKGRLNLAMLELHEAYYLIAKEYGESTSSAIRELVRHDFSRVAIQNYGPICWGHFPLSYLRGQEINNLGYYLQNVQKHPAILFDNETQRIHDQLIGAARLFAIIVGALNQAVLNVAPDIDAEDDEVTRGKVLQTFLAQPDVEDRAAFVAAAYMLNRSIGHSYLPPFHELMEGFAANKVIRYCEGIIMEKAIFELLPFASCDRSYVPVTEKAIEFCDNLFEGRVHFDIQGQEDLVREFPEFQERVCPPADCPHLYK